MPSSMTALSSFPASVPSVSVSSGSALVVAVSEIAPPSAWRCAMLRAYAATWLAT